MPALGRDAGGQGVEFRVEECGTGATRDVVSAGGGNLVAPGEKRGPGKVEPGGSEQGEGEFSPTAGPGRG